MAVLLNYLLNCMGSLFKNGDSPVEMKASTQTKKMQDSPIITEQIDYDSDATEVNVEDIEFIGPIKIPIQRSFDDFGNRIESDDSERFHIKCSKCQRSVRRRHPYGTACGHILCKQCLDENVQVTRIVVCTCPICDRLLDKNTETHPINM